MPRIATISPVWGCSVADLRALAQEAEAGGFEAILSPEVPPYNGLSNAQVFAEATKKIKVGTWITNIYMRQAMITAATATYRTVHIASDAKIPIGTSRCGRRASSECVEMESKPMNAKNTIDAPSMTPDRP